MSDIVLCANPDCGKKYVVENKNIDDGYCSQECWEHVHCGAPKISENFLDITVESLSNIYRF